MRNLKRKLKLLYLPFLIITISFILIYSTLNWLLFIELKAFSINEQIIELWLPLILPALVLLIWYNKRLILLEFGSKDRLPTLYFLVAYATIVIPTINSQNFIEQQTQKLHLLNDISLLAKTESPKYISLNNFYIDKSNVGIQSTFDVSGKHDQHFNMTLYIAMPILKSKSDTNSKNIHGFLGTEYHKTIDNDLEQDEKEKEYKIFTEESQIDFDSATFEYFNYLQLYGNTDDGEAFREAIKSNSKFNQSNQLVYEPFYDEFEKRGENTLVWIFGSFAIGCALYLIIILFPRLKEQETEDFENGNKQQNDLTEFASFIIPKEGFYVTPIILYINLIIFFAMVFSGLGFMTFDANDLLNWGGNLRPTTMNGEWWRLLTSTFLHGGFMHLFANMYGLIFVGIFLEPLLGRRKYLLVYLTTGILASCASIWWYEETVSIGASGAIFGLYGLFIALLLTKVFPPDFGKTFLTSTLIFIGYNLLMGIKGGIDNAAHIGGLLSGFLIGLALSGNLKKQVESNQDESTFEF